MKIHEYQARALLQKYSIPISQGEAFTKAFEIRDAFPRYAHPAAILKVQVQMGGRGKAGGVKRVESSAEAFAMAEQFLGKPFSTYQSGGESKVVRSMLLTEDMPIQKELYLGIVIDRQKQTPVVLFSTEGGIEIEEVAKKNPRAIFKFHFSPSWAFPSREFLSELKTFATDESIARQVADITEKLARSFMEKDASIAEINPLAVTPNGRVMALDAKIVFDDNALFRHEDIRALKDPEEDDERERRAKEVGLSYVSMTGNIGCLVNGAGLAMATMDMIKWAGGEPANFLDVGGGATTDQVREGFKIILQDERVEAILVNIFGGIMKCDVIAEGVIQASKEIALHVPLIVRLEGTRVEEGRALLKKSGLSILSCRTIEEAAKTAVREAAHYRSHVHSRS